jgi:hypothetical protein
VPLLGFAGVLRFSITPAFDRSFESCAGDLGGLIAVGSFVGLLGGIAITIIGFRQAVAARSWRSSLVGFAGVALVLCAMSGLQLYGSTWESEGCSD